MSPYKIKEECYLLRSCLDDAKRMLLLWLNRCFLLMGELLLMHDANTQCTVGGERRPKGKEKFFMFKFLSRQKI